MGPQYSTTDLYFAAALLCQGRETNKVFLRGKRVHFEFSEDISKEQIAFTNNTLMVPARYFGVNMKHLKATISELYGDY